VSAICHFFEPSVVIPRIYRRRRRRRRRGVICERRRRRRRRRGLFATRNTRACAN
jgi:hypothetical protein